MATYVMLTKLQTLAYYGCKTNNRFYKLNFIIIMSILALEIYPTKTEQTAVYLGKMHVPCIFSSPNFRPTVK